MLLDQGSLDNPGVNADKVEDIADISSDLFGSFVEYTCTSLVIIFIIGFDYIWNKIYF